MIGLAYFISVHFSIIIKDITIKGIKVLQSKSICFHLPLYIHYCTLRWHHHNQYLPMLSPHWFLLARYRNLIFLVHACQLITTSLIFIENIFFTHIHPCISFWYLTLSLSLRLTWFLFISPSIKICVILVEIISCPQQYISSTKTYRHLGWNHNQSECWEGRAG